MSRAIFDRSLFEGIQRLIPAERLDAYLHDLDRQFLAIVEASADDPDLGQRAHKIVSQAGMLGLTRMAQRAMELEDACQSGDQRGAALMACRDAANDVRLYASPAAAPGSG